MDCQITITMDGKSGKQVEDNYISINKLNGRRKKLGTMVVRFHKICRHIVICWISLNAELVKNINFPNLCKQSVSVYAK